MVNTLNLPCGNCAGRRYIRTPRGWTVCPSCYVSLINATYIKPQVKEADSEVSLKGEPWPLTDRTETGEYSKFRQQVWRSLLHYYSRRLSYEYVEGWRLVEIQFQRDPEFTSARELKNPDLLVVVLGLADPHHDFTPAIARNVQNLRKMYGKPTWTYRAASRAEAQPLRRQLPAPDPNTLKDALL